MTISLLLTQKIAANGLKVERRKRMSIKNFRSGPDLFSPPLAPAAWPHLNAAASTTCPDTVA